MCFFSSFGGIFGIILALLPRPNQPKSNIKNTNDNIHTLTDACKYTILTKYCRKICVLVPSLMTWINMGPFHYRDFQWYMRTESSWMLHWHCWKYLKSLCIKNIFEQAIILNLKFILLVDVLVKCLLTLPGSCCCPKPSVNLFLVVIMFVEDCRCKLWTKKISIRL